MSEEIKEKQERAKKILENHEYTLLTKKSDKEVWKEALAEIWHCGNGRSSSYAFDIAIMPMGIAVSGDIGEYTFNVYGRGVDFLAGRDVDYYIHSKLSRECKEEQFVHTKFEDTVKDYVLNGFENNEDIDADFAVEILEKCKEKDFNYLKTEIDKIYFDTEKELNINTEAFIDNLYDFLESVSAVTYSKEAFELLYNCDFMEFYDLEGCEFQEASSSLMNSLYLINHAAKEIMKIKRSQEKIENKFDCFVYGLMDISKTNNIFECPTEITIDVNGVSRLEVDMEMLKEFIQENLNDNSSYSVVHSFCSEFLNASIQGIITDAKFKELVDEK